MFNGIENKRAPLLSQHIPIFFQLFLFIKVTLWTFGLDINLKPNSSYKSTRILGIEATIHFNDFKF